jgi:Ser/Thr protein kinase RdoA (MazF antagonist)
MEINPAKGPILQSQDLAALAEGFAIEGPVQAVQPLGNGNVNATYLVTDAGDRRYVLQRLNRHVFQQPELVMANLLVLARHGQARLSSGGLEAGRRWLLPQPLPTLGGKADLEAAESYCLRQGKEVWRMLTFVDQARSFDTVQNIAHATEVGRALGTFHWLIHDLPLDKLADTLEGFHITPGYLSNYLQLLQIGPSDHCNDSKYCIEFVAARQHRVGMLEQAKQQWLLIQRPIHGDPKVNNVMIDVVSGQAVALVDLDTVKPGLVHYDIGDCLRSGCNPVGEEYTSLNDVCFDLDLCSAMLSGYLPLARPFLTPVDIEYLYDAIWLITFELGLRFFSDYLAGNIYFKCQHPRQNLDRALGQFHLLESIEARENKIRTIVNNLCR